MTEHYDKIRDDALQAVLRTRRAYAHEAEAMARELIERRSGGGGNTDAERWQFYCANIHRLHFVFSDCGKLLRVDRIEMGDALTQPIDVESLNAAIDAARSKA